MRKRTVAVSLALTLLALMGTVSPAVAGPPEGVSGRMVFEDVPGAFVADNQSARAANRSLAMPSPRWITRRRLFLAGLLPKRPNCGS
jgi:hypothetical protein